MAITKIQSESLNLADTYDFTGTVTGAGGGITQADIWRANASLTISAGVTTYPSSWERADDTASGKIGTGMSHSGGVFSFPETGIYLIQYSPLYTVSNDVTYSIARIIGTQNNSSYSRLTDMAITCRQNTGGNNYYTGTTTCFFDVTDTSNCKIKLQHYCTHDVNLSWSGDDNITEITFIRLGDT
jgi:hypothetical protein